MKIDKSYTNGRMTELRFLKTRNGFNNARIKFVLDAKAGFHDIYSKLEFAKEHKLLSGSGVSYSFKGTDVKFSFRKFLSIYEKNAEFAEAFDNLIANALSERVNAKEVDADERDSSSDDYDDLDDEFEDD